MAVAGTAIAATLELWHLGVDPGGVRQFVLRPHLDERQRRLMLGSEAAELGRGGIKTFAEATSAHPDTVARGVRELAGDPEPQARVRGPGGGRKKLSESDPGLLARLKALVDPETRGDPMSLLVWTTKSTRDLAGALTAVGHPVSDRTVARMLASLGFSLQGTPRSPKAISMPTGTLSSVTLQPRSPSTPRPASPWSASTPRRRNSWGRSRTAAGSTRQLGHPSRSTSTTRSSAKRSLWHL